MTNPSAASGLAVLMLAGAAALGAALPAHAATNATMSACFEQWQSEKDAGTVAKGELWADYYKACAARIEKIHSRELPLLGKGRQGASLSEVRRGK